MRALFTLPAMLLALALAGCVAHSTSTETRLVTDAAGADGRRRAEVHTALAGEYYARGNHAVALEETRLALKDDPTYAQAHNMQALVYMELREDTAARKAFDKALRLSPNNPELLNNFGWFLCLQNETDRGLSMMQRAASDTLYASPEKAMLSAGLCLRRAGRMEEAEQQLRRAVLVRPDLIGALFNLADISLALGKPKDAEIYLLRYMRLSQPTLEALALGVRVARANGDKVAEDSFMQQLRRRFADSPQLRALEASRR
ncbi:MAG TPA: type IV pilus biogenesis/stability protein PilW [Usitatibacter sp.]|nr:type IV pilus biogenesis/stability protein PilW [Usitatibacter sp.]